MNMFRNRLKSNLIRFLWIWGFGCVFGAMLTFFVISPLTYSVYSLYVPTPGNVVALNSDTINKAAIASDLLHRNSDLMGRYSHYTTPHPAGKETLFCMECSGSTVYSDEVPLDKPTDESSMKLSQVYKDATEINKAVICIIHGLSIQHQTLIANLKRLREKHTQGDKEADENL